MRGGKRKGAGGGKPTLPPGKKRVRVSFTIRPDQDRWLRKQDTNRSKLVERAIDLLMG